MSSPAVIKFVWGEDIRRVVVEADTPSFAAIDARARQLFPAISAHKLKYSWRDEDGDSIVIATDSDLREALQYVKAESLAALRIHIEVVGAPQAVLNAAAAALSTPASNTASPSEAKGKQPASDVEMSDVTPVTSSTSTPVATSAPAPAPAPAASTSTEQPAAPSASNQDEDSDSEEPLHYDEQGRVIHPGVTCDGCSRPITGVRYKCAECYNFDLCEDCEAQNKDRFHPDGHVTLKIRNPTRVYLWSPYSRHHNGGAGRHGGSRPRRCGGGRCGVYSQNPCAQPQAQLQQPPQQQEVPQSQPQQRPQQQQTAAEFVDQRRILAEMGFVNDTVNLRLLQQYGNLESVISRLTELSF